MMDTWTRRRSDNYNQEVARTRSQNRKPPHGNWQPTVPSWERKFCAIVGSLPWRNILDAKKFIHLYDNVLKWNDSAGEEAFINAKSRYWAQINGLSCQISSPDPDIYIDKIDWNSDVDPQLILDIESEYIVPENQEKREQVVIFGELFCSNNMYFSTGWGDAEDDAKNIALPSGNKEIPWEDHCAVAKECVGQSGWEDVPNDPGCENQDTTLVAKNNGWEDDWDSIKKKEDGWNQWENENYESDTLEYGRNSRVWKAWDGNQENTRGYMSRYKTSRFHGIGYTTNREWGNQNGRNRVNFVCELPYMDHRQWNSMNSCSPIGHHGSCKQGNQWSLKKQVS